MADDTAQNQSAPLSIGDDALPKTAAASENPSADQSDSKADSKSDQKAKAAPVLNTPAINTASYYQPVAGQGSDPDVTVAPASPTPPSPSTPSTPPTLAPDSPQQPTAPEAKASPVEETEPVSPTVNPTVSPPAAEAPVVTPTPSHVPAPSEKPAVTPSPVDTPVAAGPMVAPPTLPPSTAQEVPAAQQSRPTSPAPAPAAPAAARPADVAAKLQAANASQPAEAKRKKMMMLVMAVVIIALIAVGIWLLLPLFSQSTTNSLTINEPGSGSQTSTGGSAAETASQTFLSGEVCTATTGTLFFYNLDEKKVYSLPMAAGQTMFRADVPEGQYQVVYQTSGTGNRIGATDGAGELSITTLVKGKGVTGVSVCTPDISPTAMPQESFSFGGEV